MAGRFSTDIINVTNDISLGGSLYVDKNVLIKGNLTTDGSTTFINTETINVSDNIISINNGMTGTPPLTLQSGIKINRGNEDPYVFIFDETNQTFRIGIAEDIGGGSFNDASTQAVATREDNPIDKSVAIWNSTLNRFDTSSNFVVSNIATKSNISDSINVVNGLIKLEDGSLGLGGSLINNVNISTNDYSFALIDSEGNYTALLRKSDSYFKSDNFIGIETLVPNNTTSRLMLNRTDNYSYIELKTADNVYGPLTVHLDGNYGLHYTTAYNFANASTSTLVTKGYVDENAGGNPDGSIYSVQSKSASNTFYGDSGFLYGSFGLTVPRNGKLNTGNEIIGYGSGNKTFTGSYNTIIGASIGSSITSANYNTLLGFQAGSNISSASSCVAIGYCAAQKLTTSIGSVAIGHEAASELTTSTGSVAIGYRAGQMLSTGAYNTFIGSEAGRYGAGDYNVCIGAYAGLNLNSLSSKNIFIGYQAGYNESANDRFQISNSGDPAYPLMYGRFDTSTLIFNRKVGIGLGKSDPSAYLHLAPGAAEAKSAPLKFSSGYLLSTPEFGAMEYDNSVGDIYITDASNYRQTLVKDAYASLNLVSGTFTHTDGTSSPNVVSNTAISINDSKYISSSNTTGLHTILDGGAGRYAFIWSLGSTVSSYDVTIRKNGASGTIYSKASGTSGEYQVGGSGVLYLNVGDTIGMYTQGAGNNTTVKSYSLTLYRIGR